jgi:hypothetical protein
MWYRVLARHAPVNAALAAEVADADLRLPGRWRNNFAP